MKRTLLLLALSSLVGCQQTGATKAPFSLAVVPSSSFGVGGRITATLAHDKRNTFYVVLTNVSKEPQSVWEYWNSWGYQTISFEMTTASGQKVALSKKPQDFTVNFPSTFLIKPGEHEIYSIALNEDWDARPSLPKADEMQMTLKAVYEVIPSPEATQQKVWAGRVESRNYILTVQQW